MTISALMAKMIGFSQGNIHDIDHLIRVWTYARTIGELEGLDIACPLCRWGGPDPLPVPPVTGGRL